MEEAGAAGSAGPGDGAPGRGRPLQPPAKGRELFGSPRKEPEGSVDCPSVEFEYGDADGYAAELSGLYRSCTAERNYITLHGNASTSGVEQELPNCAAVRVGK